MTRFCGACGAPASSDEQRFCRECGAALSVPTTVPAAAATATATRPVSNASRNDPAPTLAAPGTATDLLAPALGGSPASRRLLVLVVAAIAYAGAAIGDLVLVLYFFHGDFYYTDLALNSMVLFGSCWLLATAAAVVAAIALGHRSSLRRRDSVLVAVHVCSALLFTEVAVVTYYLGVYNDLVEAASGAVVTFVVLFVTGGVISTWPRAVLVAAAEVALCLLVYVFGFQILQVVLFFMNGYSNIGTLLIELVRDLVTIAGLALGALVLVRPVRRRVAAETVQPGAGTVAPYQPVGSNPFAITAMVLGLFGISLLGIVFGCVALSQLNRNPTQGGRGMAWTGIIAGTVWVLVSLALLILLYALASSSPYSSY